MKALVTDSVSAFAGPKKIATGELLAVVTIVKKFLTKQKNADVLILDHRDSKVIEIDFRGNLEAVLERLLPKQTVPRDRHRGPGRPKLGVIAREITLLPAQWDWLNLQPGGASVTLRKLVEESRKKNVVPDEIRRAQESTYRFMQTLGGDLPNFEEALRALYNKDRKIFVAQLKGWPKDLRDHALLLSKLVFDPSGIKAG